MTVPSTPIMPPSIGSTSLQRIAQWISWTDTHILKSGLLPVYYQFGEDQDHPYEIHLFLVMNVA